MPTYDRQPTMDDKAALDFCRTGYLTLERVVPDEVNKRVMEYLEHVTLNPAVTGVAQSLLGHDFGYVGFAASHRRVGPQGAQHWHRDGGAVYGPQVDCLQVFYLPQDTPAEMGPTELLPGSHLLFQLNQSMAHCGQLRGSALAAAPAGSIFVTHYGIWHRRSASTAAKVRSLFKFWYLRTASPERDWVVDPGFEVDDAFHTTTGPSFGREMHRTKNDAAELFYWLSGRHEDFSQSVSQHNLSVYFARRAEMSMYASEWERSA